MSTRAANSMGPTNKWPNADDSQTHHHNSGFDATDDDTGDVAKLPQSGFAADSITEPSAGPAPQQPRPPPATAAPTNSTGAHEVNGVIGNGGGAGLFNGYFGGLFGGYAAGPNVPLNINGYTTKKSLAQGMLDLALLASNASQLSFVLTVGPAHPFYTLLLTLIATSMGLQVSIK